MQTGAYGLHRVDYNDEHGPIENTKELFMKKLIFLMVVLAGAFAHAQNIVGDWQGALRVGPSELRLVLHIAKADNGGFKATLDSIDQGANGIPVSSVSLKDSQLDLKVEAVNGTYQGKVNNDGTIITGTWTQGSQKGNVKLTRN